MTNLVHVAPFFIVKSVRPSVSFYTEKLGFTLRYIGPDESPFYAMVGRDQISIMLKAIAPDIKPVPNHTRHEWARWDAFIYTVDPDALYEEYRLRDIAFAQPLRDDADGLRGFEIADVDGYILYFGRPINDESI